MRSLGRPHLHHRQQDRPSPDSPMPVGFFRCLRGRTAGDPELRLAAAVLEDATHSFKRTHGAAEFHRRLLYWEVEQWFASRSCAPLFSFERVCLMLGLKSDEIRAILEHWTQRRLGGVSPAFPERGQPRLRAPRLQLVTPARFAARGAAPASAEIRIPRLDSKGSNAGMAGITPGGRPA